MSLLWRGTIRGYFVELDFGVASDRPDDEADVLSDCMMHRVRLVPSYVLIRLVTIVDDCLPPVVPEKRKQVHKYVAKLL